MSLYYLWRVENAGMFLKSRLVGKTKRPTAKGRIELMIVFGATRLESPLLPSLDGLYHSIFMFKPMNMKHSVTNGTIFPT
jgi:hypothetical protein